MSLPPEILTMTPLAVFMSIFSIKGFVKAKLEASTALLSPSATAVPIIANPNSFITVLTSAKSKFISPGCVIKSVSPFTPSNRTLSAFLKASANDVCSLDTLNKF